MRRPSAAVGLSRSGLRSFPTEAIDGLISAGYLRWIPLHGAIHGFAKVADDLCRALSRWALMCSLTVGHAVEVLLTANSVGFTHVAVASNEVANRTNDLCRTRANAADNSGRYGHPGHNPRASANVTGATSLRGPEVHLRGGESRLSRLPACARDQHTAAPANGA